MSRTPIAVTGLLLSLLLVPVSVLGNIFTVNIFTQSPDLSPGDGACLDAGGFCSLQAAIQESSARAGADTVMLPAGTYEVINPVSTFTINDKDGVTTVQGAGADLTFIDGNDVVQSPMFDVRQVVGGAGSLTMTGLTIHNGVPGELASGAGGTVRNLGGTLGLTNVVIRDSHASYGGAVGAYRVLNTGTTSLFNVSLIDNTSNQEGGAIQFTSPLTLNNVTISGNVSGNVSGGFGGAVSCGTVSGLCGTSGALTINNSTIVYNRSMQDGGLGGVSFPESSSIANSIIAENREGRGFLRNCDGPTTPDEVASGGHNLIQGECNSYRDPGTIFLDPTNVIGSQHPYQSTVVPLLAPLADNGSGILTHALLSASRGVDEGNPVPPDGSACLAMDANGTTRPENGDGDAFAICDMGAFELPAPADSADLAITKTATATVVPTGGPVEYTIQVVNNGPDAVTGATVVDLLPSFLGSATWTCVGALGGTCTAAGSNDIIDPVDLPVAASVTYTLNATFTATTGGPFDNFAYVGSTAAIEVAGGNNGATETIMFPTNAPPVASDDSYVVLEDIPLSATDADGSVPGTNDDGVLVNDSDDDGDTLMVTNSGIFTPDGIGGSVNLAADGTFVYTPPGDMSGVATFDYTVSDGTDTDTAVATLTVQPVNDAPTLTVGADQTFPGNTFGMQSVPSWIVSVDFGPNEGGQAVLDYQVAVSADPNGVLASIDVLNDGTLQFTLTGASGTADLSVTVQDNGGTANSGIDTSAAEAFSITVQAPPDIVDITGIVITGVRVVEACESLDADFTTIAAGSMVVFMAPSVSLGTNFLVEVGASFNIVIGTPASCPPP